MDKLFTEKSPLLEKGQLPLLLTTELEGISEDWVTYEGAFEWSKHEFALSFSIKVNLPSRGSVGGYILENESVLLVFNQSSMLRAPVVFSNRKNFPRNTFPHVNPSDEKEPVCLCLTMENPDEWYSDKGLIDVLIQTEEWFKNAASGELVINGGFWEPQIQRRDQGVIMADTTTLVQLMEDSKETPYHHIAFEKRTENISVLCDPGKIPHLGKYYISALLIPASSGNGNNQFFNQPSTYRKFKKAIKRIWNINLEGTEQELLEKYPNADVIFLIIAVKRPLHILGFSHNVEFMCFSVEVGRSDSSGKRFFNKKVDILTLLEPFTPKDANHISDQSNVNGEAMILGCGSLGSKIAMHLGRSGLDKLTLIDKGNFMPHNTARHNLTYHIGYPKSSAMANEISACFPHSELGLKAIIGNILNAGELPFKKYLSQTFEVNLNNYTILLDTSASKAVNLYLTQTPLPRGLRLIQTYFAQNGKLGILHAEGAERNPRIDDIEAELYHRGTLEPDLALWLNSNDSIEHVPLGMGCSSPTLRMADDQASYHAALMSRTVKEVWGTQESPHGILEISYLETNNRGVGKDRIEVPPVEVLSDQEGSGWETRVRAEAAKKLKALFTEHHPKETGGVLVGSINHKTQRVYVTDIIPAPPDSVATTSTFIRGVVGLSEQIEYFRQHTGGILGYIGTWHSHPQGPCRLSSTDYKTIREQLPFHLSEGIPSISMLVCPDNELSVFINE